MFGGIAVSRTALNIETLGLMPPGLFHAGHEHVAILIEESPHDHSAWAPQMAITEANNGSPPSANAGAISNSY